jgi:hypothetical protein
VAFLKKELFAFGVESERANIPRIDRNWDVCDEPLKTKKEFNLATSSSCVDYLQNSRRSLIPTQASKPVERPGWCAPGI